MKCCAKRLALSCSTLKFDLFDTLSTCLVRSQTSRNLQPFHSASLKVQVGYMSNFPKNRFDVDAYDFLLPQIHLTYCSDHRSMESSVVRWSNDHSPSFVPVLYFRRILKRSKTFRDYIFGSRLPVIFLERPGAVI